MDALYFDWLLELIGYDEGREPIPYNWLLQHLHNREFTYSIRNDANRAEDGIDLRYRFGQHRTKEPCSVLEMMVALADRMESTILDDPAYGNRTGQWFWMMIANLGLISMTDDQYDIDYVDDVIDIFLDRNFEPDGRGGLFTVRNSEYDLREVEIWIQMLWFINTFV